MTTPCCTFRKTSVDVMSVVRRLLMKSMSCFGVVVL